MLVPELDDRGCLVDPVGGHDERALVERVEIAHDEHEVARLLHGQEPRARDVDDEAVLEDLHRSRHSRLQLEDVDAAPGRELIQQRISASFCRHVYALGITNDSSFGFQHLSFPALTKKFLQSISHG